MGRDRRGAVVGHSKYDKQLIIEFLNGHGDTVIQDNAKALQIRGASSGLSSPIVTLRPSAFGRMLANAVGLSKLKDAMKHLTTESRVYLQGHGDWQSQKLADWDAAQTAAILCGAGMPAVKTVSVLGCELGRDQGTANDVRVSNSADSYGLKLHKILKDSYGIETVVRARIYCVGLGNSGWAASTPDRWGRKIAFDEDDKYDSWAQAHKRTESTIVFYWDNGVQRRKWAY